MVVVVVPGPDAAGAGFVLVFVLGCKRLGLEVVVLAVLGVGNLSAVLVVGNAFAVL
jgi:hypothetical protein